MQLEPTTLAYLAGMIDADGYITIHRSSRQRQGVYHAPQIGIAGTRREPHDLAASIWGGNVGFYQPADPRHLGQYQWSRQGAAAVPVIEAVRPYLLIKRAQADLALDLWMHLEEGRGTTDDPFPRFRADYDAIAARDAMRSEMIDLNLSRSRLRAPDDPAANRTAMRPVGKKAAGRVLDGRTWDEMPGVQA